MKERDLLKMPKARREELLSNYGMTLEEYIEANKSFDNFSKSVDENSKVLTENPKWKTPINMSVIKP